MLVRKVQCDLFAIVILVKKTTFFFIEWRGKHHHRSWLSISSDFRSHSFSKAIKSPASLSKSIKMIVQAHKNLFITSNRSLIASSQLSRVLWSLEKNAHERSNRRPFDFTYWTTCNEISKLHSNSSLIVCLWLMFTTFFFEMSSTFSRIYAGVSR